MNVQILDHCSHVGIVISLVFNRFSQQDDILIIVSRRNIDCLVVRQLGSPSELAILLVKNLSLKHCDLSLFFVNVVTVVREHFPVDLLVLGIVEHLLHPLGNFGTIVEAGCEHLS